MRVLVQKSKEANCTVSGKITGSIKSGLVLFVGFTDTDSIENINYLVKKIVNLRIFEDENNIMNKSILDQDNKEVLSISQFTLYADTKKGNRPSYNKSLKAEKAIKLYDLFNQKLSKFINVQTGIFGSEMVYNIKNDGPVTIILESRC